MLHCLEGKEVHSDGNRSAQKWCQKVRYTFGANSQPQERSQIVIPFGFIAHSTPTATYYNENARINSGQLFHGSTALVCLSLLFVEVSRSQSDTPRSVGLLRTSERLVADTCTWQQTTLKRYGYPCPRPDSNPKTLQAKGRRHTPQTLRPQGSANITTDRNPTSWVKVCTGIKPRFVAKQKEVG